MELINAPSGTQLPNPNVYPHKRFLVTPESNSEPLKYYEQIGIAPNRSWVPMSEDRLMGEHDMIFLQDGAKAVTIGDLIASLATFNPLAVQTAEW